MSHDCGTLLVPIPSHMPEAFAWAVSRRACDDPASDEYGRDAQGRACFKIDACIAPALLAVWAAGFKTLGCCCGHGQSAGGIITLDTGDFSPHDRTGTQEYFAELHATRSAP